MSKYDPFDIDYFEIDKLLLADDIVELEISIKEAYLRKDVQDALMNFSSRDIHQQGICWLIKELKNELDELYKQYKGK